MEKQLIDVGTGLLAAIIVMILHELPKTAVFYAMDQTSKRQSFINILKLYHYIDPIGLIMCVATYGGFSKPYMYRIKEKKVNYTLGIVGFSSLFTVMLLSVVILKNGFGVVVDHGGIGYPSTLSSVEVFFVYLFMNIAFMSIGMFLVNLFPLTTFDMGNIIAGISPTKFIYMLRRDYILKIILLFVLIMGVTTNLSQYAIIILLR